MKATGSDISDITSEGETDKASMSTKVSNANTGANASDSKQRIDSKGMFNRQRDDECSLGYTSDETGPSKT